MYYLFTALVDGDIHNPITRTVKADSLRVASDMFSMLISDIDDVEEDLSVYIVSCIRTFEQPEIMRIA